MSYEELQLDAIALGGEAGIVDGPFGSNLPASDYVPIGVPVIRGSNLSKGDVRFKSDEFVFVSEATAHCLDRSTCVTGDIIFTKKGTLGQVGIVPASEHPRYLLSSNQMRLRVDHNLANPEFVYYALANKDAIERIIRESEHTGVPKINLAYIRRFRIPLPPRDTQDEVAGIAAALDGRIELLKQANATLEAIAQALFKSWFVDFDPVRAKQQGILPAGMGEATAALFPDSFEESAPLPYPFGWQMGKVEDLLELAYGKALKATDRVPGDVPVYGSGGLTGFHNGALVAGPTVIVGRKGTVGSLYWEDRACFPIDTVFYVRPKVPLTFCLYQLRILGLEGMNTDGAVPGLNRNNVYRLPVVIAPGPVLASFDEVVGTLRRRIFSNELQAQTLASLRDTLLPRLISGQLRLPEAEALATDA